LPGKINIYLVWLISFVLKTTIRRPGGSIHQVNYTFVEMNGRSTSLYKSQGLDLCIEQITKGSESVYLPHYSDPGTAFFTLLIKFLHEVKAKIPDVRSPKVIGHDEFRGSARFIGTNFAHSTFPITYQYYYDVSGQGNPPIAKAWIKQTKPNQPQLHVAVSNGREIVVSVTLAQKMLQAIPEVYMGFDSFHIAYSTFMEEVSKPRPKPMLRTDQLELKL
jgi:hypothetical protein